MSRQDRLYLLGGATGSALFVGASIVLGALLPQYNPIAQTISEIGEQGSPFQAEAKVINLIVAACFASFAHGLFHFSEKNHLSKFPAFLIAFYAASETGSAVFELPHPWHNLFGIASIVGLLAPGSLALRWPSTPHLSRLRIISAVAGFAVLLSIALNLSPLFADIAYVNAHYGLVQRTMFVFFLWCAYVSITLYRLRGAAPRGHG